MDSVHEGKTRGEKLAEFETQSVSGRRRLVFLVGALVGWLIIVGFGHWLITSSASWGPPVKEPGFENIQVYTGLTEQLREFAEAEAKKAVSDELEAILRTIEGPSGLGEMDVRLNQLAAKLTEVDERSLGLRQAIDPDYPEEVLTLARMSDSIRALNTELISLRSDLVEDMANFRVSVRSELSTLTTIVLLMLGALGSLLVTAVSVAYSVWRDFKTKRGGHDKT